MVSNLLFGLLEPSGTFKVSDATRNGTLPHNPWLQFHTSALVRYLSGS